jgi:hypothetical protein
MTEIEGLIASRVSSRIVTGPSFTRATDIIAPNSPQATG